VTRRRNQRRNPQGNRKEFAPSRFIPLHKNRMVLVKPERAKEATCQRILLRLKTDA
jgi:hypothetical protein